jgi:16S rRNA (adenine1518-N6/adenine1519-N6)-dimethyltransferase
LLRHLGVRPSKGLGQNFLVERGACQRLVSAAGIEGDDFVVEIGPGLGILTEELLARAHKVLAVELDARLATHLRQTFAQNDRLEVIEADALHLELDQHIPLDEPVTIAANLPYSSATAIIRHLLEQRRRPRRLAVMVQREVAERITAEPPDMTILGVATRFYSDPRMAFVVPPDVFVPPPKVESAVVVLDVHDQLPLPESMQARFFQIVNAGFRQRRKQLANTLAAELRLPKPAVLQWLSAAGITGDRRAQTLTLDEWLTLAADIPDNLISDIETQ